MIAETDFARKEIRTTTGDKWIALQKYKTLRNRVTTQVRNEVKAANGKRIAEATNESEYWKVVNDVTKAKSEMKWKLDDGVKMTKNEEEVSPRFNNFFVNKIEGLKANIDVNFKTDPLQHLEKKVENNNVQKRNLKTLQKPSYMKINRNQLFNYSCLT